MHGGLKFGISELEDAFSFLSFYFWSLFIERKSWDYVAWSFLWWRRNVGRRASRVAGWQRRPAMSSRSHLYYRCQLFDFPPMYNITMCDSWNFMEAIWSISHPFPNNNHLPFTWAGRIGEGLRTWSWGWLSGSESPLPFFSYVNLG